MGVFNYATYAKKLEIGISKPNMTKIAKALFEPIIIQDGVVNQAGNPYTIDSKQAKFWFEQTKDIPGNIKTAAGNADLVNGIGDYFSEHIVDELINQNKEAAMYSAMVTLVRNSDLEKDEKELLLQFYSDGDRAEFLGRAFLFAVVRDNTIKDPIVNELPAAEDIRIFKELVKKNHKKPTAITPPTDIEDHELGYVEELYRVYHEKTGEDYVRPADLESQPKLKRDFERHRKDYYSAETIRRELRDTIRLDEEEGFDVLKSEMYDGVITTRDKDYDSSYDRLQAVLEHATSVPISHNLEDRMLDWVGAGEKKGVCHMLVNDKKLSWTEE